MLDLARDLVNAEKEVPPAEDEDCGKTALTELFQQSRNAGPPIMVERVINDIDDIVCVVRLMADKPLMAAHATSEKHYGELSLNTNSIKMKSCSRRRMGMSRNIIRISWQPEQRIEGNFYAS